MAKITPDGATDATKKDLKRMNEAVDYLKQEGFFTKTYSNKKDAK